MADFVDAPMEALQSIIDEMTGNTVPRLTEAPRMVDLPAFHRKTQRALQSSGQTAFAIHYDDLRDLAILNGLATYLGCADQNAALDDSLNPQSPRALNERVTNPQAMRAALGRLGRLTSAKRRILSLAARLGSHTTLQRPKHRCCFCQYRAGPMTWWRAGCPILMTARRYAQVYPSFLARLASGASGAPQFHGCA